MIKHTFTYRTMSVTYILKDPHSPYCVERFTIKPKPGTKARFQEINWENMFGKLKSGDVVQLDGSWKEFTTAQEANEITQKFKLPYLTAYEAKASAWLDNFLENQDVPDGYR